MLASKADQIVVEGVARAIRASRKFGAKEHELALAHIVSEAKKAMSENNAQLALELMTAQARLGNVSAVSQDLAKAGLVKHGEPSAFAQAVAESLDALAESEPDELAKLMAKPSAKPKAS